MNEEKTSSETEDLNGTHEPVVRVLQWNVLADGLSGNDGFLSTEFVPFFVNGEPNAVCYDAFSMVEKLREAKRFDAEKGLLPKLKKFKKKEKKLSKANEGDKDYAKIKLDLIKIKKEIAESKLVAMKERFQDSPQLEKIRQEILPWHKRFERIKNIVLAADPDIITFQEVDRLKQFVEDTEFSAKYTCFVDDDDGTKSSTYKPATYNMEAPEKEDLRVDNYLQHIIKSRVAFAPRSYSTAYSSRKERDGDGGADIEDDGCVVFWKKDKFKPVELGFLRFPPSKGKTKAVVAVVLEDITTKDRINVLTTHMPSGEDPAKESERLTVFKTLKQSKAAPWAAKRCFRLVSSSSTWEEDEYEPVQKKRFDGVLSFVRNYLQRVASTTIFALDTNSRPTFPPVPIPDDMNNKVTNSWNYILDNLDGLESIWVQGNFLGRNGESVTGVEGVDPPVVASVNKMNGPQTDFEKIGNYQLDLIDHVFTNGRLSKFIPEIYVNNTEVSTAPLLYKDRATTAAKIEIYPTTKMPSDHLPVVADISLRTYTLEQAMALEERIKEKLILFVKIFRDCNKSKENAKDMLEKAHEEKKEQTEDNVTKSQQSTEDHWKEIYDTKNAEEQSLRETMTQIINLIYNEPEQKQDIVNKGKKIAMELMNIVIAPLAGEVAVSEKKSDDPSSKGIIYSAKFISEFASIAIKYKLATVQPLPLCQSNKAVYYEVRVHKEHLKQSGWADLESFKPDDEEGVGAGDDKHSYAYDVSRGQKFHNGDEVSYGKFNNEEDMVIIGCKYHPNEGIISYSVEGQDMGTAFQVERQQEGTTNLYLSPVITCDTDVVVEIITYDDDLQYLPKDSISIHELIMLSTEPKPIKQLKSAPTPIPPTEPEPTKTTPTPINTEEKDTTTVPHEIELKSSPETSPLAKPAPSPDLPPDSVLHPKSPTKEDEHDEVETEVEHEEEDETEVEHEDEDETEVEHEEEDEDEYETDDEEYETDHDEEEDESEYETDDEDEYETDDEEEEEDEDEDGEDEDKEEESATPTSNIGETGDGKAVVPNYNIQIKVLSGDAKVHQKEGFSNINSVSFKSEFPTIAVRYEDKEKNDITLRLNDDNEKAGLYYEVCVTGSARDKINQMGWANLSKFRANESDGDGCGDDRHSWSFDGSQNSKFHNGNESDYGPDSSSSYRPGIIVGCSYYPKSQTISYSLDGKSYGTAHKNVAGPSTTNEILLSPVITADEGEKIEIRTHDDDLQHLPDDCISIHSLIMMCS